MVLSYVCFFWIAVIFIRLISKTVLPSLLKSTRQRTWIFNVSIVSSPVGLLLKYSNVTVAKQTGRLCDLQCGTFSKDFTCPHSNSKEMATWDWIAINTVQAALAHIFEQSQSILQYKCECNYPSHKPETSTVKHARFEGQQKGTAGRAEWAFASLQESKDVICLLIIILM